MPLPTTSKGRKTQPEAWKPFLPDVLGKATAPAELRALGEASARQWRMTMAVCAQQPEGRLARSSPQVCRGLEAPMAGAHSSEFPRFLQHVCHPCMLHRHVPLNSICDTGLAQDSNLISTHLEHSLIAPHRILPRAFSCSQPYRSVVLQPPASGSWNPPSSTLASSCQHMHAHWGCGSDQTSRGPCCVKGTHFPARLSEQPIRV